MFIWAINFTDVHLFQSLLQDYTISTKKVIGVMSATTHPDFNDQTEGLDVAKTFAGSIRGKTIVVTGVNPDGIGFTTAESFVRVTLAALERELTRL